MAYEKQTWVDNQTPVDAEHLNHIEDGVAALSEEIEALKNNADQDTMDATKSGEIVSVTPVSGTSAKVVSKITGQEADWVDAAKIKMKHISGKNLLNIASILGGAGKTYEADGIRAVINANGTMRVSGTDTSTDAWNDVFSVALPEAERFVFPAGTYTGPSRMNFIAYKADGSWTIIGSKTGTFTISEPFWIARIAYSVMKGTVIDETIPLVLVSGSVIPSTGYTYVGVTYTAQFSSAVKTGSFDWQSGALKDANGNVVETVAVTDEFPVYNGANTFITSNGVTTVTYKVPDDGSGDSGSAIEFFDPEAWGMPVLYLEGDVTSMSRDVAVTLKYVYGTLEGTCTVKWQGSSSLAYNKKNYTIKFDNEFEAVEGWTAQKKYCFKANYIDHSHARNLVNAKLWGQIVKSRDTVPDVFANLVNAGAVDGFPCLIVLNGNFHGLYTFNIPKDGWMMGMGNGTNEAILCADKWVDATGFKAAAVCDESDFALEYVTDEGNAAWVATSVNRLINACIQSNGNDLDTTIAQYLDWQSAIDYYIFTVLIEGQDMTRKNYLLSTFDGIKWYFGAYDMDCTYGLHWNGGSWFPADTLPTFDSYAAEHRVMELIKLHKKDALKARYAELRETVLSESNIAAVFANFAGQIPSPVYMQDVKVWPMIPNTSVNNISQIRDYYRMRVAYADKWMEAL